MTEPIDWSWLDGLSESAQQAIQTAGLAKEQAVAEALFAEQLAPAVAPEIDAWLKARWARQKAERKEKVAAVMTPAPPAENVKVMKSVKQLDDARLWRAVRKEAERLVQASPDGYSDKWPPRLVSLAHGAYELCRRAGVET